MGEPVCVFISSTWRDLQPEREAVEKALQRMQDTAFAGMEYFGSRPDIPREVSLTQVDRSDVYIGIFAHRWGSGITEAEYRWARAKGIPCLIYFKDDSVPVLPAHVERNSKKKAKLEAVRCELKEHHTVSFFKSPDHLATQVVTDLHNLLGSAPSAREKEPSRREPKYQIAFADSQGVVVGDQAEVTQHFGTSVPTRPTELHTLRLQYLADNVRQDLALLKDYEDALRYEDDPRRRAKYRQEIRQLRESAARYRQQYDDLRSQVTGEPSVTMQDIAVQLRQMNVRLDALLAGQTVIQDELTDLRHDVVARFDSSERTIITSVVERLDHGQLSMVQAVLHALETQRVSEEEIRHLLDAAQQMMAELEQQAVVLRGQQELADVIAGPTLDAKHKLKLTLPIIPLLLGYEGEIELRSGLDLDAAWQRLVTRIRGE